MFPVTKNPNADLDYSIDWTAWLAGDTISTSAWTIPSDSGIVGHTQTILTGNHTITWLSGGTPGGPYRITNRIVTAGARTDERSLEVTISGCMA
jgi:hypothetical protein